MSPTALLTHRSKTTPRSVLVGFALLANPKEFGDDRSHKDFDKQFVITIVRLQAK
ncbi:MAG TPA: hypothetical protein PKD79_02310 [Candidatus Doudnabacteria bacterium]|nr:hypothetical protein [Candidatus Doudnabacteria bacterium]